jgi:hypothetical protein
MATWMSIFRRRRGCLRAKTLQREALAPAAVKDAHPIRVNPCPIFISFPIRTLGSHDDTA